MKKQKGDNKVLLDVEERSKYIDISYSLSSVDWYKPHKERYTDHKVPAKQCQQKDFGTDANSV